MSTQKKLIMENLKDIYNIAPGTGVIEFSKTPCDCCKSELAGQRWEATGTRGKKHTGEKVELSCCVDCFEYLFT